MTLFDRGWRIVVWRAKEVANPLWQGNLGSDKELRRKTDRRMTGPSLVAPVVTSSINRTATIGQGAELTVSNLEGAICHERRYRSMPNTIPAPIDRFLIDRSQYAGCKRTRVAPQFAVPTKLHLRESSANQPA